jgi:hypothetical protein
MSNPTQHILSKDDLPRLDGQRALAIGVYHAVSRPIRGVQGGGTPRDRAILTLADNTILWLEALDTPQSIRPEYERTRFDGRPAAVLGTAHRVMPSAGQSLIDPCITDIEDVRERP